MKYYWYSLSEFNQHQDLRGFYKYVLTHQHRPEDAISITSQVIQSEQLRREIFKPSKDTEPWLPKLLILLNGEPNMKTFWGTLQDHLQSQGCEYFT